MDLGKFVDWRFFLADLPTQEYVEEVSHATGKTLSLQHNRPGRLGFSMSIDDDVARMVMEGEGTRCIVAQRNGIVVWSGPIWTTDTSAPATGLNVSCVGWLEELFHSEFRAQEIHSLEDDFSLLASIIATRNAQTDANAVPRPSHLSYGGSVGTPQQRTFTYEIGQNMGEAVQQLTDIEAGFDIYVNPENMSVTAAAWDQYRDLPEVLFGYRRGPENVSQFGRQVDVSAMCNRMNAVGDNNTRAVAEDTASVAQYGIFEETVTLSGVGNPTTLAAFANAEIVVRAHPKITYSLLPVPADIHSNHVPQPFEDYRTGDKVYLSAVHGPINIDYQAVRVFGMDIAIEDDGRERVTALQLTYQGG